MTNKEANTWRVWVILIAAPLLWLGVWLAGQALWPELKDKATNSGLMNQPLRLWVTLVAELGLLSWVVVWLRNDKRRLADIGLRTDWLGRETLIGLLAGLILWVVGQAPLWWFGLRDIDPAFWMLLAFRAPTQLLYLVGTAVSEEIIWRGYALTELHRLYRLSTSVVIAIFAFATFHVGATVLFDWLTLPLMLYVGGWLSVLYLWRRSLVAPIVAHMVLSGLGFI